MPGIPLLPDWKLGSSSSFLALILGFNHHADLWVMTSAKISFLRKISHHLQWHKKNIFHRQNLFGLLFSVFQQSYFWCNVVFSCFIGHHHQAVGFCLLCNPPSIFSYSQQLRFPFISSLEWANLGFYYLHSHYCSPGYKSTDRVKSLAKSSNLQSPHPLSQDFLV